MTAKTYAKIDDPQLQADARANLRQQYPDLTDNDIENLAGAEEVRLYNLGRGDTSPVTPD